MLENLHSFFDKRSRVSLLSRGDRGILPPKDQQKTCPASLRSHHDSRFSARTLPKPFAVRQDCRGFLPCRKNSLSSHARQDTEQALKERGFPMEKKYYIAVDCEGVACAVGQSGAGLGNGENYRFACRQAAREAAAAARARVLFPAPAGPSMATLLFILPPPALHVLPPPGLWPRRSAS